MTDFENESESGTATRERVRVKRPAQFKVIMLNDDYTSMDFVVSVLETVFRKKPAEAVQIMLQVHNQGRAVCGIYSKEIAEAKISQVHEQAQGAGYPLRCVSEEV